MKNLKTELRMQQPPVKMNHLQTSQLPGPMRNHCGREWIHFMQRSENLWSCWSKNLQETFQKDLELLLQYIQLHAEERSEKGHFHQQFPPHRQEFHFTPTINNKTRPKKQQRPRCKHDFIKHSRVLRSSAGSKFSFWTYKQNKNVKNKRKSEYFLPWVDIVPVWSLAVCLIVTTWQTIYDKFFWSCCPVQCMFPSDMCTFRHFSSFYRRWLYLTQYHRNFKWSLCIFKICV